MKKHNTQIDYDYYNVDDAEQILKQIITNKVDIDGKKKIKYLDLSVSFDIEASSFFKDAKKKCALMYIWQFGITDDNTGYTYVIIGRTWTEFRKLIRVLNSIIGDVIKTRKLSSRVLLPIFVHNLAYEFSYLIDVLRDGLDEVFAVKSATPLYCRYGFIEFRCSYLLSGMALKYLPTHKFKKLNGDLDYDKLRTPETELTDTEMAYCLSDVLVLCEYISEKRKEDGGICNMCRTKTGYVRRGLLRHCVGGDYKSEKKEAYVDKIKALKFHSLKEYTVLKAAFQGGHTACCPGYNGKIVEDVTCYDFTSSYPAVCLLPYFPIAFKEYKEELTKEEYEKLIKKGYSIVSEAIFSNIDAIKHHDSWISSSKIEPLELGDFDSAVNWFKENCELNNGKVFRCKKPFSIFLTNIDYDTYKTYYKFDSVSFQHCYIYKTGYLPKEVIEYILLLYEKKTTLKGVEGKEREYALYKELLNSVYGMMVTDPAKDLVVCDVESGEWHTEELDVYEKNDLISDYNKKLLKGGIATPYIWGVFVTALARYNLSLGVTYSGNRGLWVYADTDSIYVKHADKIKDFIYKYNENVKEEMIKMCKHYGFSENCWCPKTIKGVEKPLGYWDFDGHSKYFKTLGAKRYIKWTDDDHFKITVAGLSKKDGADYMLEKWGSNVNNLFDHFSDGLIIPAENTGKLTHTIITENAEGDIMDYLGNKYHYKTNGGTHLCPASFSLSLDALYVKFLLGCVDG